MTAKVGDNKLVEADYASLELRILALYGKDGELPAGQDLYSMHNPALPAGSSVREEASPTDRRSELFSFFGLFGRRTHPRRV